EISSALRSGAAATLISSSSRSSASPGTSSTTRSTFTSLCICFWICSSECCAQSTRSVMRETSGRSVGPTARLSMLKPRRANIVEIRASAPGLSSTSTEIVCFIAAASSDDLRRLLVLEHVQGGRELLLCHLEAAVSVDADHRGVGPRRLRSDRGRDAVAHRAQAAAGDERARPVAEEVLHRPHLMLADAGRPDDVVTAGRERLQ